MDLQKCLTKRWIHSHEEDTSDVRVYRPAGYDFPPARGRTGFELRPDGRLGYYGIARTDGSAKSAGHWSIEGTNQIRLEPDNQDSQLLEVVSCDDQVLKVKR